MHRMNFQLKTIHTRIKERRLALGLSMQQLAEMSGVSSWQTVQQWEKEDGTAPKRGRLDAVAAALETTPEALMFGDEEERAQRKKLVANALLEASAGNAGISDEGLQVARAFESLNEQQREAVLAQLRAFGVFP
jgi:transcriptional regulator with XRE-family HTH domain